jgi:hypothetical protein
VRELTLVEVHILLVDPVRAQPGTTAYYAETDIWYSFFHPPFASAWQSRKQEPDPPLSPLCLVMVDGVAIDEKGPGPWGGQNPEPMFCSLSAPAFITAKGTTKGSSIKRRRRVAGMYDSS